MLNNYPLLKRIVDDVLCAGIMIGLCALIILNPTHRRPSHSTAAEHDQAADAIPESFTASLLSTPLKVEQ